MRQPLQPHLAPSAAGPRPPTVALAPLSRAIPVSSRAASSALFMMILRVDLIFFFVPCISLIT